MSRHGGFERSRYEVMRAWAGHIASKCIMTQALGRFRKPAKQRSQTSNNTRHNSNYQKLQHGRNRDSLFLLSRTSNRLKH